MFHVKFGDEWYKYKAKTDSFLDRLGLSAIHISRCEQDKLKKQENDEALMRQIIHCQTLRGKFSSVHPDLAAEGITKVEVGEEGLFFIKNNYSGKNRSHLQKYFD